MTSAPWSAAHRMPAATSSAEPVAVQRSAAVAAVLEHPHGEEPGVGRHPRDAAAVVRWRPTAMPATWVPWPLSSCPEPVHAAALPSAPMQLTWPSSLRREVLVARGRRPESTTAIVMPSPVPRAQAPGAPMRSRPHWSPCSNTGSFGLDPPAPRRGERATISPSPAPQRAASDRTDRRIHPSSVRTDAGRGAIRPRRQRRRRTVTTLPKTDTSSASNSIGESRAFDGSRVTVLPLRR